MKKILLWAVLIFILLGFVSCLFSDSDSTTTTGVAEPVTMGTTVTAPVAEIATESTTAAPVVTTQNVTDAVTQAPTQTATAAAPEDTAAIQEEPAGEYTEGTDEPVTATVNELLTAYNANQLSADMMYGDKLVSVTGMVGSVEEYYGDEVKLELINDMSSRYDYVSCIFRDPSEIEKLFSFIEGQSVTVVGTCSEDDFDFVYLSDCVVVE